MIREEVLTLNRIAKIFFILREKVKKVVERTNKKIKERGSTDFEVVRFVLVIDRIFKLIIR
jgi:hypothetical protein